MILICRVVFSCSLENMTSVQVRRLFPPLFGFPTTEKDFFTGCVAPINFTFPPYLFTVGVLSTLRERGYNKVRLLYKTRARN